MRGFFVACIGLFLLALPMFASVDSLVVHRYDEDNGLYTTNIRILLEDGRGYIWCGTEEGLMCFDGYRFHLVGMMGDEAPELHSERTQYLFADGANHVWIATTTRIFRYDHGDRRYRAFPLGTESSLGVMGRAVYGIFKTRDGRIWIATDEGISAYFEEKHAFVNYPYPHHWDIGINEPFSHAEVGSEIWMNIAGNPVRIDRTTMNVSFIEKSAVDPMLRRNDHFRYVTSLSDRSVLLVNRTALYRFDTGTGISRRLARFSSIALGAIEKDGALWICFDSGEVLRWSMRANPISAAPAHVAASVIPTNQMESLPSERRRQMPAMLVTKDGSLWMYEANSGLRVFHSDGRLKRTIAARNMDFSLNGYLLEDRSGCVWFASQSSALYRLEEHAFRFGSRHARLHSPEASVTGEDNVRAFLPWGRDSILVASLTGLYLFDRRTEMIHRADFLPDALAELHSYPVWCLARDRQDRLWIGTGGAGLIILDPRSGRFMKILHTPSLKDQLTDRRIRCIEIIGSQWAWIGTWGGVDRIALRSLNLNDSSSLRITSYPPRAGDPTSLSNPLVFDIHQDREGRLWIATEDGLNLYDAEADGFSRFRLGRSNGEADASRDIRCIFEDAGGSLWFGTHGGGLYRFDMHSMERKRYSVIDGMPSPIVYGILGDGGMELWLTTHRGLCRVNTNTGDMRTFDTRDGIQHLEFNTGAVLSTVDGYLLVGGPKGFNYFHPDAITDRIPPPGMEITRVLVNGNVHAYAGRKLQLNHDQNFLTFAFSAMSNYAGASNRYRYRLDGVDENWVYGGMAASASYTQLAPGTYVFQVIGSNAEGTWSEEAATLTVIINAPWWASNLAKGVYALLAIGLIVGFIYSQRRRVIREERMRASIREAELLTLTEEAEQRALRATSERRTIEKEKRAELEGAYAALEQAHENLLLIQQRLSTVVSGAPIVLFALDREGNFTLSEGSGLRKIGLEPGQATGQNVFTLYRDYPDVIASMRRAVQGEEFTTVNVVNGIAFETRTSALRDENGELTGTIAVSLDITEQLRTQQQIEKLSSAVEQSPAIVIITDTNGIIEYVNPTFSAVTGYSTEEIIGKTPRILKSGMQKSDDYRVMWETLLSGKQWRGELHNRRRDGTVYWVSSSISPLKNAQGEITHYIGIQEDITERKSTEAKLARRTEALETIDRIVQVVNEEVEFPRVIQTLLEQGMRLLPQAEKCVAFQFDTGAEQFRLIDTIGYDSSFVHSFTFSKTEITQRYLHSSIPLEEGIFILHHNQELAGQRKLAHAPRAASSLIIAMKIVHEMEFPDGYLVFDSMQDEAAFGPKDAHKLNRFRQHAIIALRKADMLMKMQQQNEEILRTQEQLIIQEKLASLGRLTAGIAHEIQNPLNFVINFSELSMELLDELPQLIDDTERREAALKELRETIDRVYQHGRRAEGIVNSMMQHSPSSDDERVESDINTLLEQSVLLARRSTRLRHLTCHPQITFDLADGMQPIMIVPHEFSRVFLSLIENAIDAVCDRQDATSSSTYAPQIRISTSQTAETISIRIRDNGPGIPEHILRRIFDPFFTTKSPGKGTGLGLSVCYDLIRQKYNGVISVETEVDAFTEFHISIPRS